MLAGRRGVGALAAVVVAALVAGCAAKPKGEQAPLNFTMKDPAGQTVRLADYKGRPLIINFWATYCVPCKTEIPAFNELVEKYKDKRLTVVGISIDDTPDDIRKYTADQPIHYPVLLANMQEGLLEAFQADVGIPVSWIVRPDGTVADKTIGPQSKDWFEARVKAMF